MIIKKFLIIWVLFIKPNFGKITNISNNKEKKHYDLNKITKIKLIQYGLSIFFIIIIFIFIYCLFIKKKDHHKKKNKKKSKNKNKNKSKINKSNNHINKNKEVLIKDDKLLKKENIDNLDNNLKLNKT